ncbi:MAG TPA: hypothetical protein VKW06_08830 [Candidatus Angelobacter sp.]|nr:hypothetical protein [Candidatus Angelobacter sp.]
MLVPAPKTAEELKAIISQVIRGVLAGTIEDSTARAVASLGTVMLKAFEHVDIASELQKLQQLLGERSVPISARVI